MNETDVTILQTAFCRGLTTKVFKITELSNAAFLVMKPIMEGLKVNQFLIVVN